MKRLLLLLAAACGAQASIIVNGTFGPHGDVAFETSPADLNITFGTTGQGQLWQLDGFLFIPGMDFGDPVRQDGPAADLQYGAPAGIGFTFSNTQPSSSQLLLTYTFTNNTASAITGLEFIAYADADIGDDFTNNLASVTGATGGHGPVAYQIGDPSLSSVFTHVFDSNLDGSNDYATTAGDVSLGLGFQSGVLAPGDAVQFQLLFADDSSHLGNFYIHQINPDLEGDSLTVSGQIVTPEPATWVLMFGSLAALYFARGIIRRRSSPVKCLVA